MAVTVDDDSFLRILSSYLSLKAMSVGSILSPDFLEVLFAFARCQDDAALYRLVEDHAYRCIENRQAEIVEASNPVEF